MRFLLDMGISPKSGRFLCDLGHDAVHVFEVGLEKLDDPEILARAVRENRVVVTHDLDLADLVAVSHARAPSVITFRLRDMRAANVNRHLRLILEQHVRAIEGGAILSVREQEVRIHSLPVERG